ncbi:POU domain, class 6, transcription factor 2 [Liparis tanakae]|uniref:POU domain, class 6, transcription factor 2 n=1 Tax=Liparis tanakae TaxID=230148 RepID=A0A4Z2HLF9_9TELE|nr:POU domain, class 6, transcription factor 2 [Liparis tanakae]
MGRSPESTPANRQKTKSLFTADKRCVAISRARAFEEHTSVLKELTACVCAAGATTISRHAESGRLKKYQHWTNGGEERKICKSGNKKRRQWRLVSFRSTSPRGKAGEDIPGLEGQMNPSDILRLSRSFFTLLTAACQSPDEWQRGARVCRSQAEIPHTVSLTLQQHCGPIKQLKGEEDPMITGQLSKPLLSLRSDMSAAELRADDKAATSDSDLNDEPLLLPSDATEREGTPNKLYGKSAPVRPFSFMELLAEVWWRQRGGESREPPVLGQKPPAIGYIYYTARDGSVQSDASSSPSEQSHLGQSHPGFTMGQQSLLVAQQLANAVGGVMSGAGPGMNQPILIPFNTGGHLGGQQGLVLSLPTANIQSLVAAAAAGGIMTLPLQNLQVVDDNGPSRPV